MRALSLFLIAATVGLPVSGRAAGAAILGWNNLGMHCMDSDYSVFTVLPPYNTVEAQLIVAGQLITNGVGYTVTYQALADPSGSINTTSAGKGNFFVYTPDLYGALAPDTGLLGWSMPGPANKPQTNVFENFNQPVAGVFTPVNWWRAEGIPITPYDDARQKNPYPLMRLIAWNSASQPIATNDIVLPVSDEMDCRACHASGAQAAAQPAAGWIWDGLPERDYRLNILRLHDERQFAQHAAVYAAALSANNYNPAGLYRRVTADGKPVLCALCHASEALQTKGFPSVPPLTTSVHSLHAGVMDPDLKVTLNDAANRSACYRCHPGSTTRCLRGAMGSAVASDGSMEMQCQSCHGNMTAVGAPSRIGWIMEPNCQGCHAGTATATGGIIRYTSVFTDTNGTVRVPADPTFATSPNTPPTANPSLNLSLYRFSIGHGGLQCAACHGSTHAEFPSSHPNDNLRNLRLQGHVGMVSDCTACHTSMTATTNNLALGPHGMHPINEGWVANHHDLILGNIAQCQACHGADYRGTVLSRAQANRSWSVFGTTIAFNRGDTIGCYNCHRGVNEGDPNTNAAPTVVSVVTNTSNDQPVSLLLPVGGANAKTRILSQGVNGSVGLNTNTSIATYFPNPGFVGTDSFTFAAYDGSKNSALATGTVMVTQGPYSLGAVAHVPPSGVAQWPVAFAVVPSVTNQLAPVAVDWDFGDSSTHGTNQYATRAYSSAGIYAWTVVCAVAGATVTNSGTIQISGPMQLAKSVGTGQITFSWPQSAGDVILEASLTLGADAQWTPVTNALVIGPGSVTVDVQPVGNQFLRLRRPW